MAKIVDRIFNTVLTANDSSAQEELGAFRFEDGKIYKYCQFMDAVTASVGAPCLMDGTYNHKVTVDIDAGASDCVNIIAGVALAAITPEYYGWIQIYGVGVVATTEKTTAGDYLIASADGFWNVGTEGTDGEAITVQKYGAIALETSATDADATISAFIKCM